MPVAVVGFEEAEKDTFASLAHRWLAGVNPVGRLEAQLGRNRSTCERTGITNYLSAPTSLARFASDPPSKHFRSDFRGLNSREVRADERQITKVVLDWSCSGPAHPRSRSVSISRSGDCLTGRRIGR